MTTSKIFGLILLSTIGLIGLSALFGSYYTVDQGERAVILTNGAFSSVADSGLHFKVPFMQAVVKISTRTSTRQYNKVAAYTSDRQTAEVELSVTYAIDPNSVSDVYSHFGESGDGSTTAAIILDPKLYEQFKNIFGQYTAIAAVQKRAELNSEIQSALQSVTAGSGLVVKSVQIQNIDFSDAYEAAIEASAEAQAAVQTATNKLEEVKMESQQQIVQADAAAKAVMATANDNAYRTKVQADANAYQTTVQAKADAVAIQSKAEALKANPELVAWSAVDKWNGQLPVTMVPGSAVPFLGVK